MLENSKLTNLKKVSFKSTLRFANANFQKQNLCESFKFFYSPCSSKQRVFTSKTFQHRNGRSSARYHL